MRFSSFSLLLLPVAGLLSATASAAVKLPAIISDNMVLMQDTPANVWGWAEPQEAVSVQLGAKTLQAVANSDGKWSVKFDDLEPGEAGDMVIKGTNAITVKNVAVGEVWVASGQSNMEWVVRNSKDAEKEIAEANYPAIRMFTVTKAVSEQPLEDCTGKWDICTPATVPAFSAVGYFFARRVWEELKVPIGVIHSSWGGTPAEFWTPPSVLQADADFAKAFPAWEMVKKNYPAAKEKFDADLEKWKQEAEKAKAENKPAPRAPQPPRGGNAFGSPGCLYNGMIAPIEQYTIRGAIWYQGESNAGNGRLYRRLFPAMIQSWRDRWGQPEFPFLYVQIANFMQRYDEPTDSLWAELREAQLLTLEFPHTGMAVAIDIGEANDIHPKNKQEVGRRLAVNALATVYFRDVDYSGPLPAGVAGEDGKIRVTFRFAEGLKAADGGKIKGFAVAGEDRKFYWAEAELQGDHVVIGTEKVPNPVAVRYGWANNPDCNLVNEAGLPASPFRSDDWPQQMRPPGK